MNRTLTLSFLAIWISWMSSSLHAQVNDDFESGAGSWVADLTTNWTASASNPAIGGQSYRHSGTGTTDAVNYKSAYAYTPISGAYSGLSGVSTTWEFYVKAFNKHVYSSNKFWIVLAANGTDMRMPSSTGAATPAVANRINGYAIGINPYTSGATDPRLQLMRVTSSATTNLTYISSTDANYGTYWSKQTGPTYYTRDIVKIKVVRDAAASWTVYVDFNNDGTYEVTSTPVTDATYTNMNYLGVALRYPASPANATVSNGGNYSIDNFTVTQTAPAVTYYSVAAGNMSSGSVWSLTDGGAPVASPTFNGYTSLVVKHAVVIDGSYTVNNVTLSTGGTLTSGNTGQTLTVSGDWENNSNIAAFAGTYGTTCCTSGCKVVFSGNADQIITGSVGTKFMDLQINTANTVTLRVPVYVTAAVIPTMGTLVTNGSGGSLTLLSNSTCAGSLAAVSASATVTGPVTLQRYIPANTKAGWLFLACPLYANSGLTTGLTPGNAWGASTVLGTSYTAYPMTTNSIKWYNEALVGGTNVGFTTTNPTSGTFDPKKGYNAYCTPYTYTLNPTGYPINSDVTIPLSYTPTGAVESWGKNLMSNPFPSEINWDLVEAASADVGAYFVYDYDTNNYLYYNANDGTYNTTAAYPNGIGKYIPHSQSFFVTSTASSQNLVFNQSAKTSRCTPKVFERNTPSVAMQSWKLYNSDGKMSDASNVVLNPEATSSFDPGKDVLDMYDSEYNTANLSFVSEDNRKLMAAALRNEEYAEIGVHLDLVEPNQAWGNVVLILDNQLEWPASTPMWIENSLNQGNLTVYINGVSTTLAQGERAPVSAGMRVSIPFNGEFHGEAARLLLCPMGDCGKENNLSSSVGFQFTATVWNNQLIMSSNGTGFQNVDLMDELGRKVFSQYNVATTNYQTDLSGLSHGVYFVRATNSNGEVATHKIIVQ